MPRRPDRRRRSSIAEPRSDIFTRYTRGRRSTRARAFIEHECLVPQGLGAGQPYSLRPVHRRWLRAALDGRSLVTVVSGPRGMGKTGWMAAVGVWALFAQPNARVLFVSTGLRTARKAYDRAVRIIETNDRLAETAMIYHTRADPYVELPLRGSSMAPLVAEEQYIIGEAPTMILVDEIGYVEHKTFEAMQTSLGKSGDDGSVLVAFGTPGLGVVDSDSTPNQMWQLRTLAQSDSPPRDLTYVEHAARPTDDMAEIRTWRRAYGWRSSRDPGLLGDLVSERAVAHDFATMPPSRFAQMRCGIWSDHEAQWMPRDAWDRLAIDPTPLAPGALVSLGFDGSVSRDQTALVAFESASSRLVVLGHWQGEIPRDEVMATIDRAFTEYTVSRLYADPWWWRREIQELSDRLGEELVLEYNTASVARMAPASDAFLAAVLQQQIAWDGSPALRAHMLNAVSKRTAAGDIIARDARRPRDTDLAVAAILAHEAARTWVEPLKPSVW
jgi:phage terminase large subunit-like protein